MKKRATAGVTAIFTGLIFTSLMDSTVLAGEYAEDLGDATSGDYHCGTESCDSVFRGMFAFFSRDLYGADGKSLGGNGRSCNDCHTAADHFMLKPASVEQRYRRWQRRLARNPYADDPLFRPIDADDFRTNGPLANDYSNLRQNGLVRITFKLPPSLKLLDPVTKQPTAETEVDVWRKVPRVTDVKLTGADGLNPWARGPNNTGGYQIDGRFLTLQDQALGALLGHAQIQNPPQQRTLDDLSAFQRMLFSNRRVRALSAAIDAGVTPLPDADPPLNALEQQGKAVFVRACTQCHGGAGQSTTPVLAPPPATGLRFHTIASQCPRPVDTRPADVVSPARFNFAPCSPQLARNARFYQVTLINGATEIRPSSDPGRALLTGFVGGPGPRDDWNKLDVPGLRGLRHLAPYFHNNSANTLEEMLDHYTEFFKFVRVVTPPGTPLPQPISTDGVNFDRPPLPEERAALLAYLRKL
jgi:cytochrome c peroxidase